MSEDLEIVTSPQSRVVYVTHEAPFPLMGPKFQYIIQWATTHKVPVGKLASEVLSKDPPVVNVCMVIPDDFVLSPEIMLGGDFQIQASVLGGQKCAMKHYIGPYEGLESAWGSFCSKIYSSRISIVGSPFEVYENSCVDNPEELETTLYAPILEA